MRNILVAFYFFSLACSGQQNVPPHANDILKQATRVAKAENKKILVVFTASWCGWCHKMKKSLEDTICSKFFSDNYVTCYIVSDESANKKHLENPGADSIKKQFGGEGQGLPYWAILANDGKLLADSRYKNTQTDQLENTGCPATEKEVAHFITVLQKTGSFTKNELAVIRQRFRKNEQ